MSDKTVYSYINDIAQRLKEPRKYGDVSLMIGAGFSKNAQSKGMASMQPPNWSELAEKMYEELYPEPLEAQEKEEWNRQRIIKTSGKNVTKLADEYIANLKKIIYVFLTIFLYLLKCPQSLILSALRAFCFCGKPHISRSIFLYFRYQAWLKSW